MNFDVLKRRFIRLNTGQACLLFLVLIIFTISFVFPMGTLFSKAFTGNTGKFVGFANYKRYFNTPSLSSSVGNTVFISLVTTAFSSIFGLLYAYAITRTAIPGKTLFKYIALLPIFIPTAVHALGLVYIFGKQGFVTRLGFDISLYGRNGIIISEIIYTFPQAFLLFLVVLEYTDGRLYEACNVMGIHPFRQFLHVTLPEIKFTVINTLFVCFTLAFTDFGAPKVIGGSYNVLATDIYKQIAGQFNMNMGAVVGTLLLIPAVLSFIAERFISSKNMGALNSKTIPLAIKKNPVRDTLFFLFCIFIALSFVLLIVSLFVGAFSTLYPYNMKFTLKHFIFNKSTGGIGSFGNSVYMSFLTAVFGTAFVFLFAYMMEKTEGFNILTKYGRLLSVLPLAVPGMVVGISYIFFFNAHNNPA